MKDAVSLVPVKSFCGLRRKRKTLQQGATVGQMRTPTARTIWIADAHCDDGKRYAVRAGAKLTASWKWKQPLAKILLTLPGRVALALSPLGVSTQSST
jgi:hypothetical protein